MNRSARRVAAGTLKALLAGAIWTQAALPAGAAESAGGEPVRLKLKAPAVITTGTIQTTVTQTVTLSLGQPLMLFTEAVKPVSVAADDDPWIALPAADGGHHVLFFASGTGGRPAPGQGGLFAAITYPTQETESGVFVLPEAVRGSAAGDFVLVDAVDGGTAKVAVAALGMTPEGSKRLFAPAVDLVPEERYAVYAAPDNGRTLLVFSPQKSKAGDSEPSPPRLSDVVSLPAGAAEAFFLLPRSRRGQPVPAAWVQVLKTASSAGKAGE